MSEKIELNTKEYVQHRTKLVLVGTILLSFVLGSIHAFSVFMSPMETTFGVSRSLASLTYSLALVTLATGVLFGHHVYYRFSPAVFAIGTGGLASIGCLLTGLGDTVVTVWVGYSLLFGGANGLGYGYALQLSAQALPKRKGLAMGTVTAAYAFGAVAFPFPLNLALNAWGWIATLILLAMSVMFFASISAGLLAKSQISYRATAQCATSHSSLGWPILGLLWLAYGCAVTAGLMAIGHATGIAKAGGVSGSWIIFSPIVVALFNMTGSFTCGVLVDRLSAKTLLIVLPGLSSCVLLTMALLPQPSVVMVGLAAIGFTYGGIIASYPAAIAKRFGAALGTIVYGRVFTAWAAAGLVGPGLAGVLFDVFGDYFIALIVATIIGLFSPIALARSHVFSE